MLKAPIVENTDLHIIDVVAPETPEESAEDTHSQILATFANLEASLANLGVTKHHMINVRVSVADLGQDLRAFNELWDSWMKGVEILPSMTAAQVGVKDGPLLALSVTAGKGPKRLHVTSSGGRLTRSGGGTPNLDPAIGFLNFHFPWSNVVEVGNVLWLAGKLDKGDQTAKAQAEAVLTWVEATLADVGLSSAAVTHMHVLMPMSLPVQDQQIILARCHTFSSCCSVEVQLVARTCADALVEVSCVACRADTDADGA